MGFESALKTIGTWSQKLSNRKEEGFMSRFQLISLSFLIISRLFHICQQKVLWLLNLYIKKQIIPVVRRQRQMGLFEFKASLVVCIMNSRSVWATKLVLVKKKKE